MAKKETEEQKNKKAEEIEGQEEETQEKSTKKETKPKVKKDEPAKSTKTKKKTEKTADIEKVSRSKYSKKYREVAEFVDKNNYYTIEEAIGLVKKTSATKFDSTVEIHIRLGLNPAAQDQQVRGTVALPNGTGKSKKVAVICDHDKEKEAKDAGADKVGGDTLIADIEKGKLDFDVLVATPDMMAKVGKLGKILGTKGLMPNPKAGTVTPDVAKAVKELKAGRVEFKLDKNAIVHQVIGKVSFDEKKLEENYKTFLDAIKHAKPSGAKGTYIRSISLATTMGPGIKIML